MFVTVNRASPQNNWYTKKNDYVFGLGDRTHWPVSQPVTRSSLELEIWGSNLGLVKPVKSSRSNRADQINNDSVDWKGLTSFVVDSWDVRTTFTGSKVAISITNPADASSSSRLCTELVSAVSSFQISSAALRTSKSRVSQCRQKCLNFYSLLPPCDNNLRLGRCILIAMKLIYSGTAHSRDRCSSS